MTKPFSFHLIATDGAARAGEVETAVADQDAALRADVAAIRSHPLIPDTVDVGGFLYDVDTGTQVALGDGDQGVSAELPRDQARGRVVGARGEHAHVLHLAELARSVAGVALDEAACGQLLQGLVGQPGA